MTKPDPKRFPEDSLGPDSSSETKTYQSEWIPNFPDGSLGTVVCFRPVLIFVRTHRTLLRDSADPSFYLKFLERDVTPSSPTEMDPDRSVPSRKRLMAKYLDEKWLKDPSASAFLLMLVVQRDDEKDGKELGPGMIRVFCVKDFRLEDDDRKLGPLFSSSGTVDIAKVIYNKDSDQSRGFGFVIMSTIEKATKRAFEELYMQEGPQVFYIIPWRTFNLSNNQRHEIWKVVEKLLTDNQVCEVQTGGDAFSCDFYQALLSCERLAPTTKVNKVPITTKSLSTKASEVKKKRRQAMLNLDMKAFLAISRLTIKRTKKCVNELMKNQKGAAPGHAIMIRRDQPFCNILKSTIESIDYITELEHENVYSVELELSFEPEF
ncbi:hypothetical protein CTI12_AA219470 [Artemisia annua]|uniref:RRM domain-containing protein n=1 Tax=Artemisia annua TaxID=35608 RepID=A0A2U1NXL8_ARTAN|nr:hypothetical protein CTI12_AA219470 [Artemisia annua]